MFIYTGQTIFYTFSWYSSLNYTCLQCNNFTVKRIHTPINTLILSFIQQYLSNKLTIHSLTQTFSHPHSLTLSFTLDPSLAQSWHNYRTYSDPGDRIGDGKDHDFAAFNFPFNTYRLDDSFRSGLSWLYIFGPLTHMHLSVVHNFILGTLKSFLTLARVSLRRSSGIRLNSWICEVGNNSLSTFYM